jgi:hypothetical protein
MSEDDLFNKQVKSLQRKTEEELFGEALHAVLEPPVEAPKVVPLKAPIRSKKERWLEAVKKSTSNVSEIVSSPRLTDEDENKIVSIALPPIRLVDDSESFDGLSPSKTCMGCRPDFIPSIAVRSVVVGEEVTVTSSPAVPAEEIPTESVDHLVLVVHGINGSEEYLYRNLDRLKESFEHVRTHRYHTSPSVHLELINWKSEVIGMQSSIFEKITPRGSLPPESRMFINYAISDVAFYLTPSHCELIKTIVTKLLNDRVEQLRKNFSSKFSKSKITLVGYSLGSVILHDILTNGDETGLCFDPYKLFFWGSPLAAYLAVKDREFMIGKFSLPKRIDVYNIYHPHDPVAFRIEPLFYHLDSEIADAETVPFWKTDGILTWGSVKSFFSSPEPSGSRPLVPKRRLDYVLQESVTESLSHHYSMLTAHYSYWGSHDVALFMLRRLTGLEPSKPNN